VSILNNSLVTGFVFLTGGLLASSIASLGSHRALLGALTDVTCGFLDGVSAVFFCAAIWLLSRCRKAAV
jgi:hypothetical protein